MTVRLTRRGFVGAAVAVPALAALPISLQGVGAQDAIVGHHGDRHRWSRRPEFQRPGQCRRRARPPPISASTGRSSSRSTFRRMFPTSPPRAEQGAVVVAVGYLLTDAITSVARQFPDEHFVLIDGVGRGAECAVGALQGAGSGLPRRRCRRSADQDQQDRHHRRRAHSHR